MKVLKIAALFLAMLFVMQIPVFSSAFTPISGSRTIDSFHVDYSIQNIGNIRTKGILSTDGVKLQGSLPDYIYGSLWICTEDSNGVLYYTSEQVLSVAYGNPLYISQYLTLPLGKVLDNSTAYYNFMGTLWGLSCYYY